MKNPKIKTRVDKESGIVECPADSVKLREVLWASFDIEVFALLLSKGLMSDCGWSVALLFENKQELYLRECTIRSLDDRSILLAFLQAMFHTNTLLEAYLFQKEDAHVFIKGRTGFGSLPQPFYIVTNSNSDPVLVI